MKKKLPIVFCFWQSLPVSRKQKQKLKAKKIMKRISTTHAERLMVRKQANRGFVVPKIQWPAMAMLATIHAVTDPIIAQTRQAELAMDSYTERHGIENSPELYGRECSRMAIYSLATMLGGSCDVEVSEVESGLLASVKQAGNAPEKS
jgi:hypothetical protein